MPPKAAWPSSSSGSRSGSRGWLGSRARARARSDALGDRPVALAVRPPGHAGGFFIADDLLGGRIEAERSAQPGRDVAQMGERGRDVADRDLGVGAAAGADRFHEVFLMVFAAAGLELQGAGLALL